MSKSTTYAGALLLGTALLLAGPASHAQGLKRLTSRAPAGQKAAPQPTLVFQSGFEGTSRVGPDPKELPNPAHPGYAPEVITGVDNTLGRKNDWVADLDRSPDGGTFMIQYTGGDSTKRWARIIPEPGNPGNHVLAFQLNDFWEADAHQVKARVQTALYGIKSGYREFYQSVRVFLPEDFRALRKYPDKIKWLTISEFWNNTWWEPTAKYGFRITLGIGKPVKEEGDLCFILNAENTGQIEVWNANQHPVKVPIGQWFTMDYYFKEGDAQTGRFYMAITPEGGARQVVFDVKNYTHSTTDPRPDGLTDYNPMKLYTSKDVVAFMRAQGKPLQIYWDDFKLWKNKQPD
ncbi:hypothetical protein [Hymenobacter sp. PAMC 26628]|uniref:hypothetical protein n=1 Tax=Hymenobacter sp. PAMC 26628 TaxID=1484118 RepID=UPI00076FF4E4|nr:hypothetical protein [Hymenobacter sp. PAMC 26628]AMJ67498.1 hypothetical protein AXW84_20295 [Hymenobacter sp. PAMC 26628]